MTWVKLSDIFAEETEALSDRARRLHVDGLCFSMQRETGGFISKGQLRRLAACKSPMKAAAELVEHGFWRTTADGWAIVHHMDHQPTVEEILAARADAARRKREERRRKLGLPPESHRDSTRESHRESHTESQTCPGRDGAGSFTEQGNSTACARAREDETRELSADAKAYLRAKGGE